MTTHDKAMAYLAQPEFQNRPPSFMQRALVARFGLGERWAEGIVWEFRKGGGVKANPDNPRTLDKQDFGDTSRQQGTTSDPPGPGREPKGPSSMRPAPQSLMNAAPVRVHRPGSIPHYPSVAGGARNSNGGMK